MIVFFICVLQFVKELSIFELGLDVYFEFLSVKDFIEVFKIKKGVIKVFFFDQVLNSSFKFLCGDVFLLYDVCVNDQCVYMIILNCYGKQLF